MRVGIDLDNTILDYRAAFAHAAVAERFLTTAEPLEKVAFKQKLFAAAPDPDEGERRWQHLQARVYGGDIHQAQLFEGFEDFIRTMGNRDAALFLVSHKTETSNYDPSVNLRRHARETLTQRGLIGPNAFPADHIFFESTRDEKVARIAALDLDVFIDDLPSVLAHVRFPKATLGLCFGQSDTVPALDSWSQLTLLVPILLKHRDRLTDLKGINEIKRGGNNRLYHLAFKTKPDQVLKLFQPQRQENCRRETNYLRFLAAMDQSPKLMDHGDHHLIMAHIPGNPPDAATMDPQPMIHFLLSLVVEPHNDLLGTAAHGRFQLQTFADHLQERRARLMIDPQANPDDPHNYHLPYAEQVIKRIGQALEAFPRDCARLGLKLQETLAPHQRFPSPSDFGPHNALVHGGHTVFVDFEYAGWDDPAKLMGDMLLHVGHQQPWSHRRQVVRALLQALTPRDPLLPLRLEAVFPLMVLEWVLIAANIGDPTEWKRKRFANPDQDPDLLRRTRRQTIQTLLQLAPKERIHDALTA